MPTEAVATEEVTRCALCGKTATHRVVTTVEGRWVPTDRYVCEDCRLSPDAPVIVHL